MKTAGRQLIIKGVLLTLAICCARAVGKRTAAASKERHHQKGLHRGQNVQGKLEAEGI